MINDKELDFWIENDLNVLFEGRHGVGKTAVVTQAFERHNLNWRYFSAATMDPWVDFVGVPEKVEDGDEKYIDLIRPRGFHNGEVEAIFMDELNRAPKKVRNAVMELIQFRSINGVKFPNLRFVWAAINPEDEDSDTKYDVDALDPAQYDRFEIQVEIPYEPDARYFRKMYGDNGTAAISWWKALNSKQQELVSPRRLEYAIKVWQANGSVRHVLKDKSLNVSKLISLLSTGPIEKKLKELNSASDSEIENAFSDINFVTNAFPLIVGSSKHTKKYGKFLPKDMISGAIVESDRSAKIIVDNIEEDIIEPILKSIDESGALTRKKMKELTAVLGDNFAKHVSLPAPPGRPNGNVAEILEEYYRKVNRGSSYNGSLERQKILTDVRQLLINERKMTSNENELVLTLMLLSAIISRTVKPTLNKSNHLITSTMVDILDHWKICARAKNIYIMDIWNGKVRPELARAANQKKIVKGRYANIRFEEKDLDKIEEFIEHRRVKY